MLGMAVDANVLIYERLREERDRGASLALAIRNGYDRAFPTIIDTHLTSIFTAIVLYVVGNDQLKGFGVSLTVGLIISLFTSLYMTRLMFDFWLSQGLAAQAEHVPPVHRGRTSTSWRIRYYWFTATILLTVLGIAVFILRLPQDLNIDFVGGTAYGGQLVKPMDITELRNLLSDESQDQTSCDSDVDGSTRRLTGSGHTYDDHLRDRRQRTDADGRPAASRRDATERERRSRSGPASLPDWSVEQIFPSVRPRTRATRARYFTVRTSEKAPGAGPGLDRPPAGATKLASR